MVLDVQLEQGTSEGRSRLAMYPTYALIRLLKVVSTSRHEFLGIDI